MKIYISICFSLLIVACKQENSSNQNAGLSQYHELSSIDDNLHIKYSGKGDSVVFKMFSTRLEAILLPRENNNFEGKIEIPDLDIARFSYDIGVYKKVSQDSFAKLDYKPTDDEKHFVWEGADGKRPFLKSHRLEGRLETKNIDSKYLNENRSVSIYTPPQLSSLTPIIYFSDGTMVEYYADYIDQLISQNLIKPIMLVGIHSSEQRYTEYVYRNHDTDRFKNHARFFHEEAMRSMESDLENWQGKRYLYGVSNGAAFCLYLSVSKPQLFEEVIAFSAAGGLDELGRLIAPRNDNSPNYYMASGRYEKTFLNTSKSFHDRLKSNKYKVDFKELVCGHDYNAWRIEFLEYLLRTFGNI